MKKKFMLVFTLVCTLFLGACSSTKSNDNVLKYALNTDISGLDTSSVDDEGSIVVLKSTVEGLMVNNEKGETIPGMAKSYTVSDDELTYTFTLRDASWSNGDKVKADDFVYAWQRMFANKGNYTYMYGEAAANIKNADELSKKTELTSDDLNSLGIKAIDDKTVEITLENKVPFFSQLMTFTCFRPINRKFAEKQGKKYGTSADTFLSNGPFTLKSWTKGSKASLVKNDKYYDNKNVQLEGVDILLDQDSKTAAAAYQNGKVDLFHIDSANISKYKNEKGYFTYNTGFEYYLSLNLTNKALANKNIRYALSYALNKKDFSENVLKDGSKNATGFVLSDMAISPSGVEFRKDASSWENLSYDKKKAQDYLNKGLSELGETSITLNVLYGSDEETMKDLVEYIEAAYNKLEGLKVNLTATVKKDRTGNKMPKGEYDIALTRWGPDYQDPTTFLNLMYPNNQNNFGKYNSETYKSYMDTVYSEKDLNKRWEAMVKADQTLKEDLPIIPVYEKAGAMILNPKYTGFINKPVIGTIFKYVHKK